MLNAAKSYISFAAATVDSFVDQFGMHGLYEIIEDQGDGISGITICHKEKGVFPLFASLLDRDFSSVWSAGKSHSLSLQVLLYNLPFVHRAYQLTYSTRKTKVEEMFLLLQVGSSPEYIKGSDGKAYLRILLDPNHFPAYVTSIPNNIMDTISDRFALIGGRGFALRSVEGAKWNSNGSVSSDLRDMMNRQRKDYCYIRSSSRIWYLRRLTSTTQECLQLNTMTINMAIMHRLSEIVRYKPEQLQRLLQAEENWLLHEYMSLALDQFLDELAAEITHKDIMCTGVKE